MFKRLGVAILVCIFSVQSFGQDELTKSLSTLLSESGKAYVGPISSAFGADLNSGWVHRAVKSKTWGIDLELAIIFSGAMFNDDVKSFKVTSDVRFDRATAVKIVDDGTSGATPAQKDALVNIIIGKNYRAMVSGPTIVGKKSENVMIEFPGETTGPVTVQPQKIKTPATGVLDDLKFLPLPAPQLTVGTLFGTAVSVRYLPSVKVDDNIGEFKYLGFGLQHNPSMWIPFPIPVDVSLGFFTQNLEVGKYFKTSATTFGIYASKQFGPGMFNITPYAGFAMESAKMTTEYDVELKDVPTVGTTQKVPMKFELEGDNASRIILGLNLKLAVINIHADYNISTINVFSAGLAFAF